LVLKRQWTRIRFEKKRERGLIGKTGFSDRVGSTNTKGEREHQRANTRSWKKKRLRKHKEEGGKEFQEERILLECSLRAPSSVGKRVSNL